MSEATEGPYSISGGCVYGPGISSIEFGRRFAGPAVTPTMLKCCGDLNKAFSLGVVQGKREAAPKLSADLTTRDAEVAEIKAELNKAYRALFELGYQGSQKHE